MLHASHGERDQAIHHLKAALGGYRQTGADRDQARVRRRLRQLGIRRRHWSTSPARPVTGWDSLTDTEQAVADLVAQGLNNNQVAARMYISTHTVAHHLRQAFRKLSIASRVELTRIVIEQAADGSLALIAYGRLPTRAGDRVRCRNCFGMLRVISQIRDMNCIDLGSLTAFDPGQGV